MSSIAKIDRISSSSNDLLLFNGYPRQPGRIIECLSSPCDGSEVRVASGVYKFENVIAAQASTTTYADITGSSINYVPPIGTREVVYSFHFNTYWGADHAINHYKFFMGSDEVLYARHCRSQRYNEDRIAFEWAISIGGETNMNYGRLSSWTHPLNLHMQVRQYGGSNFNNIHSTYYWDGAGGNQLGIPVLTITAMA
jgi:hypothetical protein